MFSLKPKLKSFFSPGEFKYTFQKKKERKRKEEKIKEKKIKKMVIRVWIQIILGERLCFKNQLVSQEDKRSCQP